ncbi:MAG: uridine kinase, partial [Rubrobacteraceae bacterium]
GKTVFAEKVSGALDAPTLHMDDIYPGWDGLADAVPKLVGWILEPLAKGRPVRYRRFDWERGEYAEWNEIPPPRVLVVEGVGSGARAASPRLSFLVWVEAPKDLRMRRGIERDGEAFRPHWEMWARQEEAMFAEERTRERADLLVDGSPIVPHDPEREFVGEIR